jgi:hypothetical protein
MAWAVFDGHGGDNGTQVARVASLCVHDFLAAHWVRLRSEPEEAFREAFSKAQSAIRDALVSTQPGLVERDGVLYGTYVEEDGLEVEEAADGGTTATVICLVDGSTLVHAQVRMKRLCRAGGLGLGQASATLARQPGGRVWETPGCGGREVAAPDQSNAPWAGVRDPFVFLLRRWATRLRFWAGGCTGRLGRRLPFRS